MRDVTVATYPEPTAAHLARLRLESEGIEAWVDHENFAAVYPLPGSMLSGVRLKVWEVDADHAARVIQGNDAVAVDGDDDVLEDVEPAPLRCPDCDSERWEERPLSAPWLVMLSILTFGLYVPVAYRRYRCMACGHRW